MCEGLDKEFLAVYDLLKRPDLSADGIKRIKAPLRDRLAKNLAIVKFLSSL
jgi:hypothetical protein